MDRELLRLTCGNLRYRGHLRTRGLRRRERAWGQLNVPQIRNFLFMSFGLPKLTCRVTAHTPPNGLAWIHVTSVNEKPYVNLLPPLSPSIFAPLYSERF